MSAGTVIRIVDLFAGIGGLRQGAEQAVKEAGFTPEIVFTSEIKPDAIKTLIANWPEKKTHGDITKISEKEIPSHQLLLAGFPCQAFSSAGNRKGFNDTRGTLFFDVLRILKHHSPSYFVLENVEGLIKHDPDPADRKNPVGRTLKTILTELRGLGYNVEWELLQATDFGVPQLRKRIFIVGNRERSVDFSKIKKTTTTGLKQILEQNPKTVLTPAERTFKQKLLKKYTPEELIGKKISNKRGGTNNIHSWDIEHHGPVTTDEETILEKLITERRKSVYAIRRGTPRKDGIPLTIEEINTFYSGEAPTEETVNSLVNKGYLAQKGAGYDIAGGKLSFPYSNFLDENMDAPTIVASDADRLAVVQNGTLRKLTQTEFKRLFGFEDTFIVPETVSKRGAYDLFGNSVVVPVAKEATALLFTRSEVLN